MLPNNSHGLCSTPEKRHLAGGPRTSYLPSWPLVPRVVRLAWGTEISDRPKRVAPVFLLGAAWVLQPPPCKKFFTFWGFSGKPEVDFNQKVEVYRSNPTPK